ncbi:hypothetical protein KP509_31G058800 [Ceratopteris richardii]|uniref:Uncharacterized protein n=1 Tax=Ceratopteris richardii TaxID=49495 RepID=A0A8T2QYF7_CERRI|nr:hypothetical protein KP509_31G058800 [Ceratopteris richardii]
MSGLSIASRKSNFIVRSSGLRSVLCSNTAIVGNSLFALLKSVSSFEHCSSLIGALLKTVLEFEPCSSVVNARCSTLAGFGSKVRCFACVEFEGSHGCDDKETEE